MRKKQNRKIILEDGTEFYGEGFGSREDRVCEIVFNTSMAGYQEILSDPSYTDQAVVMTYPLIGNYGMAADDYESVTPSVSAMIVREYNDEPSGFRSDKTLGQVMEAYRIAGISGVDTRALTRSIRDYGTRKALITDASLPVTEGISILQSTSLPTDAVPRVSCRQKWISWPFFFPDRNMSKGIPGSPQGSKTASAGYGKREEISAGLREGTSDSLRRDGLYGSLRREGKPFHVVAIDCGMKLNIVRSLNHLGCRVTVVPWNTPAPEILFLQPDGILVSNGPGNPEDVPETIETVRSLIGSIPIFGICLGHQILSLAYGARTYKLKFGHRGGNHPVKDLATGRIEITSQNHSYAVDEKSLEGTPLEATHINLLDRTVEGVQCLADRAFGIQYHPESAPGPQDSVYLFERFLEMMC